MIIFIFISLIIYELIIEILNDILNMFFFFSTRRLYSDKLTNIRSNKTREKLDCVKGT